MNQRSEQVASVVRRLIQEALSRGLNDPRIRGLVSVASVRVTDDLAEATIGVSVLPDRHAVLAVKGLQHAAGHLQRHLAEAAELRRVPRLRFVHDTASARQAAVDLAVRAGMAGMEETGPDEVQPDTVPDASTEAATPSLPPPERPS